MTAVDGKWATVCATKSQTPFPGWLLSNINYPRMSTEGSSFKYERSQEPLILMKLTFKKIPTICQFNSFGLACEH